MKNERKDKKLVESPSLSENLIFSPLCFFFKYNIIIFRKFYFHNKWSVLNSKEIYIYVQQQQKGNMKKIQMKLINKNNNK